MNIRFIPFNEVSAEIWAQFVDECDECWIYHKAELIRFNLRDSRSFAIYERDQIIGVCVLYVNKIMLGKVLGSRIGPAGLALKTNISKKIYPLILDHLKNLARINNCLAIQMELCRLAELNSDKDYLSSYLGNLGFSLGQRYLGTDYLPSFTIIFDLSKTLEEISNDFSRLVKRKCARFVKGEYQYECFEKEISTQSWEEFVINHRATFKLTGATPFPEKTLAFLRGLVENSLGLLINVYVEGSCCASLYLMIYKRRAFFFASGVKSEFYDSGCRTFIYQLAITELKTRGVSFFGIGYFFPSKALEGTKLYSIGQFKRMFGGEQKLALNGELILNEWLYFFLVILPGYIRKMALYFWKKLG
jgi:hypothetical protein